MRPTLYLQPIHSNSAGILRCFFEGKPLTPDQHHFLEWHQNQLSNGRYDPILHYYLRSRAHQKYQFHGSFLLPHEAMNLEAIQALKKRIKAILLKKSSTAVISLTQKQFLDFQKYAIQELIFFHGNQLLTGAPFFPGGIPPVIFFQWGNLFGIAKYLVLPSEKSLKANLLVYFEDMQERDLDRCVKDYNYRLQDNINLQKELGRNEVAPENKSIPSDYFLLHHF